MEAMQYLEIITENFPELMEVMNIQISEAKHITSRIKERNRGKQKRKKSTVRFIIVKL